MYKSLSKGNQEDNYRKDGQYLFKALFTFRITTPIISVARINETFSCISWGVTINYGF